MNVDTFATKKAKTNKTLLLLAAVFLLPVLLAKLALQQQWFNPSVTNRGQLLQPTLALQSLLSEQTPKWRLLYLLGEDCEQSCDNALYSIKQVWTALGRKMPRAEAIVLITEQSDQQAIRHLSKDPDIHLLSVEKTELKRAFSQPAHNSIFLVDTLNNAVLRYPTYQQKQQALMSSRDILSDLRKLLKLSRIG